MKNVQFLHPPSSTAPPFSICLNGSELGKSTPTSVPGRQNLGYQPPPLPTPIPFGILAAYRLYVVDFSITYHARATHNSTTKNQFKLNPIFYSKTQANMSHMKC